MAAALSLTLISKSDLKLRVKKVIECPICLELFKNPKSLPCLHTFCLLCLQNLCKDKEPRDAVPCPVCRKEFEIPEKGLDELPHNFFVQNLIDTNEGSSEQSGFVLCDACQEDGKNSKATKYCVDCNQKLCSRCSRPHRAMRGGPHKVKEHGAELTIELIQQRGSYCDKHTDKRLELYCFTCKMNVCMKCCIVAHQRHECKEIEEVAPDFGNNIDSDVRSVSSRVSQFHAELKQTDDEDRRFKSVISETLTSARKRVEDLKRFMDNQLVKLESDLQGVQLTHQKESSKS